MHRRFLGCIRRSRPINYSHWPDDLLPGVQHQESVERTGREVGSTELSPVADRPQAGRTATQWRGEGASIATGRETCSSANGAGCIHARAGSVVRKDRYHSRTLWSFKSFVCTSPAFIDSFKAHRLKSCGVENRSAVVPQEDRFRHWRLVLLFGLPAILAVGLVWYGFQRQAQIQLGVSPRRVPAGATKPAVVDTRRSGGLDRLRESVMRLPGSSKPEALRAEDNARKSMQAGDSASAIPALNRPFLSTRISPVPGLSWAGRIRRPETKLPR